MICADCHKPNKPTAKACVHCGSVFEKRVSKLVTQHIPCSCEGCPTSAIINQRTLIGWAQFCLHHYDEYWIKVARGEIKEYSKPLAETFRAKWYAQRGQAYEPPRKVSDVMGHWSKMHGAPPKPTRQREPGDDDETLDAQGNPV